MLTRSAKQIPLAVLFLAWLNSPFSGAAVASDNLVSIRGNPGFQHLIASLQVTVNKEDKEDKNHF